MLILKSFNQANLIKVIICVDVTVYFPDSCGKSYYWHPHKDDTYWKALRKFGMSLGQKINTSNPHKFFILSQIYLDNLEIIR